MTHKSGKVAALVARFSGGKHDPRYLGFFNCFNRGLYYEAHDVLEDLWLIDRKGPDGDFYRGLIQLAGAFVLLGKNRPRGARALFVLAERNLSSFPRHHAGIEVDAVLLLAASWRIQLDTPAVSSSPHSAPHLTPPG